MNYFKIDNKNMKQFKKTIPILLLACTALFSSCNTKPAGDAVAAASPDTAAQAAAAPVAQDDVNWSKEDGLYAVFTNAKGQIVCKLEYVKAPLTVANFVTLAEGKNPKSTVNKGKPFFNGLTWHRVEPGFVIQGGDPNGNGSGGPGYSFINEVDPALTHSKAGTLAMANSGPNTNGSQIYITKAPTPPLDGKYNVFGYVVSGMSVVNATAIGDKMDTVTIVRVGEAAKAFDAIATFSAKMASSQKQMDDAKKQQDDQMQAAIKEHNAQIAQMAAADKGWDAKVKAKFPTAKRTASGLYYTVDKQGSGVLAKPGQTVVAHYTGTLWDGTKFDSSKDRGQPFEFPLGQHRVIDGWDEGFGLMKVGSKGKLIIPYYLAYGDKGAGGAIPPKADLIFEVEMLGVK
jgi:peptidyl-prolyl cis-trans isomerase A (cyclophilin A)